MSETPAAEARLDPLDIAAKLRDQGWNKISISITRGGAVKIDAEAEGAKVAGHQWSTGRR